MDLVHEQDVALLERREDGGEISLAVERRAGDGPEADPKLRADHMGEARLAETRRAGE